MITEKNSSYLFIGNVTKGANTNVKNLPNGAVAVIDAATGNILTSAISDSTKAIKIAMRTSKGALITFSVFTLGDVVSKSAVESASLDTQQVSFLGATAVDNVTGMGTITAGKTYTVNVVMHNLGLINTTPEVKFGAYKALTTDAFDFVTGLKDSFDRQLNNPYPMITVDRVSNGTRTAFDANVTVTNGSTKASLASGTAPTSGYVKLKGVLYKVVSGSGANFYLDRSYTGASGTINTSESNSGTYDSITHFGLRFTAVRQSFDPYTDAIEGQLLRFDIVSEDLSVSEYKATAATPSITDGARVAYLEKYSQFLHRQPVVSSVPLSRLQTEADPTKSYKLYHLEIAGEVLGSITIGAKYATATNITIAVESSLSEGITTVLGIS